ncbi:MAG: putative zinc-binding peptidase [Bacteroidota bacterium]
MKLFRCSHCGQPIYFENTYCEKCGLPLGFESESLQLLPLVAENDLYRVNDKKYKKLYRYCSNYQYNVCNWLVPDGNESEFCRACELNHTIPDLNDPTHLEKWKKIEVAKHRLVYSLLRMKLPLVSKTENEETGLAFDFVADENQPKGEKILTGHDNGLITINIAEADDITREMARKSMHEVYRTLLGHFRHEIAHYYWDRLIANTSNLEPFRRLFGDDSSDYADALKLHYEQGAPADWNNNFISSYASSHPWEDWAETWAHYMHIVDTLETAYSFGLSVDPPGSKASSNLVTEISEDPYQEKDFAITFSRWLPLTFAMNSLNRSMGLQDLYPFVISSSVVEKMKFIHSVIGDLNNKG